MLQFEDLKNGTQTTSLVFSVFFNVVLIFLILTKSPPKMGTYRYLMIYFSLFATFFSIMDEIVKPYIHTYGNSFAVISDLRDKSVSAEIELAFISILCGCFGVTITFFAIHLIFRSFALERKGKLSYFKGWALIIWTIIPIGIGTFWSFLCYWNLGPTPEASQYMKESLLLNYNLPVDNISYIGGYYWIENDNGITEPNVKHMVTMTLLSTLLICSLLTALFYARRSYCRIKTLTKEGESNYTRNLQKQLYKALLVQAFIPLILMYIPVGFLFALPVMKIHFEKFGYFVTFTYALYPAVDPLPIIFIVDNYREAIIDIFKFCGFCNNRVNAEENIYNISREIPEN